MILDTECFKHREKNEREDRKLQRKIPSLLVIVKPTMTLNAHEKIENIFGYGTSE